MIVGKDGDIEPGAGEAVGGSRIGLERVALLNRDAVLGQGAFEVEDGEVGVFDQGADVLERIVGPVAGDGAADAAAELYIADGDDGDGRLAFARAGRT
jgi:hypothetical protein